MAYPQAQLSARPQTAYRKFRQASDPPDGARRHGIEAPKLLVPALDRRLRAAQELLEAFGAHIDRLHATSPHHLFQERPLLSYRLEQRCGEVRPRDLERQARKPGAAADIQVLAPKLNPARQIQALAKVPCNAFLRRSNRGQVDSCVPPEQEIEISNDLADLIGSQVKVEGSHQIADVALGQHRHKRHCNSGVNVCRRVDIQHKWRVASALRSSRRPFSARLPASVEMPTPSSRQTAPPSKPLIFNGRKYFVPRVPRVPIVPLARANLGWRTACPGKPMLPAIFP